MSISDEEIEALLPEGSTLGGKYLIAGVLGRGGMGVVVAARHLRLQRDVALKVLLPALRADPSVVARFEREGRAASKLLNPHVARVVDVDALPDGTPFIVMERLRGKDLSDLLVDRGPLPYREAVGYMLEACVGMVDAHKAGIVHRDLKPNNLFLDDRTGKPVLKILDFGISKVTEDENQSMTATSTAFGTPLYMSPEQVRSTKHVDQRADIWSLGIVLYELLCGETPFAAPAAPAIIAAIIADTPKPISERRPDLPPDLAAVVMRTLAKDPNARYPDVSAFAAALAPFGPTGAAMTIPPSTVEPSILGPASASTNLPLRPATAPPRGARSMLPIAAGMVIAIVAGSVFLVLALRKAPPAPPIAETAAPRPVLAVATGPVIAPVATLAPTQTTSVDITRSPLRGHPPTTAAPEPVSPSASGKPRNKPAALPAATDKPAPVITPDKPTPVVTPAPTVTPDKPVPPPPVKPPPPPDDPKYL